MVSNRGSESSSRQTATKPRRYRLAPFVFVAAIAPVIATNVHISRQQATLLEQRDRVKNLYEQQARELDLLTKLRPLTKRIEFKLHAEREYLSYKLRRACATREDFLITQGDRIAWSRITGNTRQRHRIALYLPPGKHRLKYAVREYTGSRAITEVHEKLMSDALFRAADAESIGLDGGQVYEVDSILHAGDDRHFRVEVIGPGEETIYDQETPLQLAVDIAHLSGSLRNLGFPSGFDTRYRAWYHFRNNKFVPVNELFTITAQPARDEAMPTNMVGIRFWVESEAPPSLAGVVVANHYEEMTEWRDSSNPFARDNEFENLFKPYDGSSGRFYFRDDVLLRYNSSTNPALAP